MEILIKDFSEAWVMPNKLQLSTLVFEGQYVIFEKNLAKPIINKGIFI